LIGQHEKILDKVTSKTCPIRELRVHFVETFFPLIFDDRYFVRIAYGLKQEE